MCRTPTLLRMQGARIYDDVHVSGHLSQEEHYEMLDALRPEHLVPVHQDMTGFSGYVDLATGQGYELGDDLHVTSNGNTISLN
jgi:ribonuclease J